MYRRLIFKFLGIARPLNEMLTKDALVDWGTQMKIKITVLRIFEPFERVARSSG